MYKYTCVVYFLSANLITYGIKNINYPLLLIQLVHLKNHHGELFFFIYIYILKQHFHTFSVSLCLFLQMIVNQRDESTSKYT